MRTVNRDARYSSAAQRVHSVERGRQASLTTSQDRLRSYQRAWRAGLVRLCDVPAEYRAHL
jgi:hypothetical protein